MRALMIQDRRGWQQRVRFCHLGEICFCFCQGRANLPARVFLENVRYRATLREVT